MESFNPFPPIKRPNSSYSNSPSASTSSSAVKRPQQPLYVPPGYVAFRLICHASRVGGLIGKSGCIIKQIQQLTSSKIRVEDPPNSGSDHRVITVIASPIVSRRIELRSSGNVNVEVGVEENGDRDGDGGGGGGGDEWFDVSPAQEGIVRVFERVVEVAAEGDVAEAIGGVVSCRMLAGRNQVGPIIGKGGKVVEKIRKDTGCRIKVLLSEKLPCGSFPNEEIVEIEGDVLAVKKALIAVTGRLQEFPPPETNRAFGTRPFESETFPVPTVDALQQSPVLQPIPSNSSNNAIRDGFSLLDTERVSNPEFRPQQQEVVFKILCPSDRIGRVIGKGGTIVKSLQNESGAFINIGPIVAECDERLITITAIENIESQYSPAQNAALLIFKSYMGTGSVNGLDSSLVGSPVLAQVVVPLNQVGCLLGKGGAIITEMRKVTGASLRIIGGNQVPRCVSENTEVLQITGEFVNVQDALYKVMGRLRDNIFSQKMSNGNGLRNNWRIENGSYGRATDPQLHPSHVISGNPNNQKSLTHAMGNLGISNNINQSPSMKVSGVHQEKFMDGNRRLTPVKGGLELGSGNRSAIVTNTTVEIVVPENVIVSIYGEKLARLREISGAKVMVHDPRPGTTDRIIVISGTPGETQAAQSLLQAFLLP